VSRLPKDEERQLVAYIAAILLAPINAARHGHGILDDERSIAVREARYLLEEIERHFAKEPVVRP
jgi:hypothetical protein